MKHTWASGVIELLSHADSHSELNSAFDKRIAFISIDNAVETAIRVFISLPSGSSGVRFPREEVTQAGDSFPKLVGLVFKHAPDRVVGLEDGDIEYYHRIRNRLYHEGTGLSVDERQLIAYRAIGSVLLENLFGVPVETEAPEASLGRLILLRNEIESQLKSRFEGQGIDYRATYKWEFAAEAGILDLSLAADITELRMIRNKLAHSTSDELDAAQIALGVALAEKILERLKAT